MAIIYKAYKEEDGNIVVVEAGSDLDMQLAANQDSLEIPGLNQGTNDQGTEPETEPAPHTHEVSDIETLQATLTSLQTQIDNISIPSKGLSQYNTRLYFYTNNRWVGHSTLYGPNYVLQNQNRNTGAEPSIQWNESGLLFPAGAKLKRLIVKGVGSSSQMTDMEVCVKAHDTDFSMGTAISNAAEVGATTVAGPIALSHTNGGPGNMQDMHVSSLDLNEYVFQNDGDLHVYFRPVGNLTGTRYEYVAVTVEWEID